MSSLVRNKMKKNTCILLHSTNSFLLLGVRSLLLDVLHLRGSIGIEFLYELTEENIRESHVIIIGMEEEDVFSCTNAYRLSTKKNVIALVPKQLSRFNVRQQCMQSQTLLYDNCSIRKFKRSIELSFDKKHLNTVLPCGQCFYQNRQLTKKQYVFAVNLISGANMSEISKIMNINEKTAYNHKYHLMQSFGVVKDKHLLTCLKTSVKTYNIN